MAFFTSGIFWFIEGILATVAVAGFYLWMKDRGVTMTPWKWVLVGLWICLASLTIAFVGTNVGENETTAALKGGVMLGVITIAAGVGTWRLLHASKRS
ncbi:MAG: dehalogenase [Myxococcota bacterium]|nr:dehalogenase [Myxococcota bacterium]